MKTIIAVTIAVVAAVATTPGCSVKTIHQDNREKLIELLERSQKLEQKMDRIESTLHSLTNQVFMIPVFPDDRNIVVTNDILQAFGHPAVVPL